MKKTDRIGSTKDAAVLTQERTENDLRVTREALRDREERLRAIFDQAAIGIAVADFDGRLLEVNPRSVELFGYPAEELQQLTFLDVTHPADAEETRRCLKELLSGEIKEYSLEKRYIRKDGSIVWSHTTATVLRDANNEPYRLVGILEDITSRKEAGEALRKSETFSRAIIESSKDCIKILNLDGTLKWISEAGRKALRIPRIEDVVGKSWIDFWGGDERVSAQSAVDAALKGGTGSFTGYLAVGERSTWWSVVLSPILDLAGKPEQLLAVSRDMTDRLRIEHDLRDESHLLELLNKTGAAIASRLDLQDLLQLVTNAATEISGADVGAFSYNSINDRGEELLLYTLSGAPPEAFESFDHPRATELLGPAFRAEGIIRFDDVLQDSRYEKIASLLGLPSEQLEVRSYLAVPVISRSGDVIGGLFFGHPDVGVFTERTERILQGIASQAAIAIDNARLYGASQRELADRIAADAALRKIQQVLRLEQVRLESIIQFSEDAIVTKSLQGVIQSWNPSAERIFGYTASEAIGQSIRLIIPLELHSQEDEILAKISRGERVEQFETERVAKDGKRLIISLTSSPIKDDQGVIVGATKIARDITERRRQQAALEESEARYRTLAEERSTLLNLESRARQQVEEANRIKDQFLATLSHELRTPLNAILGWSQLVARDVANHERVAEGLNIIERNARSQAQIIEDLLDMNRIVSGTIRLEMRTVNLRQVIEEAIETVIPVAQQKGLTIERRYDDENLTVVGDANRLKQIAWNLLTNAVKFSGREKKIEVAIRRADSKLNLVIVDQGEGITPEFLPFIFDRFSQADTSSTRRFGGLGLGLSIVRHLVELHGGKIAVESEGYGRGATFTVALPIAVFQAKDGGIAAHIQRFTEPMQPELFLGLRALVVDDEPDARNLIKALLEGHGAKVVTAGSAEEGLEHLAVERFDLILSDVGMPHEDGYQFMRKVRELPQEKNKLTPAIALTAYARSEDRVLALRAGFQMHVPKPVEPSELIAVIGSVRGGGIIQTAT